MFYRLLPIFPLFLFGSFFSFFIPVFIDFILDFADFLPVLSVNTDFSPIALKKIFAFFTNFFLKDFLVFANFFVSFFLLIISRICLLFEIY